MFSSLEAGNVCSRRDVAEAIACPAISVVWLNNQLKARGHMAAIIRFRQIGNTGKLIRFGSFPIFRQTKSPYMHSQVPAPII